MDTSEFAYEIAVEEGFDREQYIEFRDALNSFVDEYIEDEDARGYDDYDVNGDLLMKPVDDGSAADREDANNDR